MQGNEPDPRTEASSAARFETDEVVAGAWRRVLVEGQHDLLWAHRMFRHLPGPPRCKLCHNPFGGAGGRLVALFGFRPSRKNPNLCERCCDRLPAGGLEVDVAVLFADVRDSTALCERLGSKAYADLLNSFYRIATSILIRHDAIIDKLIGDEVMALFIPGIAGSDYRRRSVEAALDLQEALVARRSLPLGIAVNCGPAFAGNVGGEGVVDFTAVGDSVNAAARMQAMASAGEILLVDDLYAEVASRFPGAPSRTVSLRGVMRPVDVRVLGGANDSRRHAPL